MKENNNIIEKSDKAPMKVGVISLGCDKNRVNSETMLYYLNEGGYEITNDDNEADVLIVNTCGFIQSAREESIETIFSLVELKKTAKLKKLIMSGCMSEKYIDELFDELVEVDAFMGTNDYPNVCKVIESCFTSRVNAVRTCNEVATTERYLTTPMHYAYLLIADGCDNHCTYCTIPQIRGKFKSKSIDEIMKDAYDVVTKGAKELILVAQDVTSYGIDLYGEFKIVELIQKLSSMEGLEQIRLLYCYPEKVSEELIDEMANNDKVVKYIDIPLQHVSTSVLKRMGRFGTNEQYKILFNKLKERVPGIAIRSTVMVGFPGETEEEYQELSDFMQELKPVNCGVFAYSDEDDAPSRKLPNKVDEDVKQQRLYDLMGVLADVSVEWKEQLIGSTLKVVYEDIDFDNNRFVGRSYISAPDIDSYVFFTSDELVEVGETYDVKITAIENDDLIGERQ